MDQTTENVLGGFQWGENRKRMLHQAASDFSASSICTSIGVPSSGVESGTRLDMARIQELELA